MNKLNQEKNHLYFGNNPQMTQLVNFILIVLLINLIINVQQSRVFYFINIPIQFVLIK